MILNNFNFKNILKSCKLSKKMHILDSRLILRLKILYLIREIINYFKTFQMMGLINKKTIQLKNNSILRRKLINKVFLKSKENKILLNKSKIKINRFFQIRCILSFSLNMLLLKLICAKNKNNKKFKMNKVLKFLQNLSQSKD